MTVSEILKDLGFLSDSGMDRNLVFDLWKCLNGDEKDSICVLDLKIFLCAIMNFNYAWMKTKKEA